MIKETIHISEEALTAAIEFTRDEQIKVITSLDGQFSNYDKVFTEACSWREEELRLVSALALGGILEKPTIRI